MTTPYSRGYSFERKVLKYLEELGYTVFRFGGSHGPADLIAIYAYQIPGERYGQFGSPVKNITKVWLIQCQRSKYFSKDKKEELAELARTVSASHTLAWSEDARKRGNAAIKFSDDTIVTLAPKWPALPALRSKGE